MWRTVPNQLPHVNLKWVLLHITLEGSAKSAVTRTKPKCALLQIDVEGSELEVLQGVLPENWACIKQVRSQACWI